RIVSLGEPWNIPQSMRIFARLVVTRGRELVTVLAPPRNWMCIRLPAPLRGVRERLDHALCGQAVRGRGALEQPEVEADPLVARLRDVRARVRVRGDHGA